MNLNTNFLFLFILNMIFTATTALCDTYPFITTGYFHGGDSFKEFTTNKNDQLRFGQGLQFTFGAITQISNTLPHQFELQYGVGYFHQDQGSEENLNHISWSRVPIEIIYYYKNTQNNFRLGWGPIYHMNNVVNSSPQIFSQPETFKSSLGLLIALDFISVFVPTPQLQQTEILIGLKYQIINYESKSNQNIYNANALGLSITVIP